MYSYLPWLCSFLGEGMEGSYTQLLNVVLNSTMLVFFLGLVCLRWIERRKSAAVQQRDFVSRWADEYFDVLKEVHLYCNEFVTHIYGLGIQVARGQQNSKESRATQSYLQELLESGPALRSKVEAYGAFTDVEVESDLLAEIESFMALVDKVAKGAGTEGGVRIDRDDLTRRVRDINKLSRRAHESLLKSI